MSNVVEIQNFEGIAVLRLHRPQSLNALSSELARTIAAQLIELDASQDVDGIVLTGAGKAFCAGVDLEEARTVEVADIETWFGTVCNIYKQILLTDKPVVAALNGVAAGGGFQIALVSDQRVAHPGVRLGQPEINAGIPSIMGSYWMGLHLGWAKNQELSMTGALISAEEAAKLGLINHLVNQEDVLEKACLIARQFASKPRTAWLRTKARFREIALAGFEDAFRAGVLGQQAAYAAGEPQAVIDAFLAKKTKKS